MATKLDDLTTAELVTGFNALTDGTVKRFTSRAVGYTRILNALGEAGKTESDFIEMIRPTESDDGLTEVFVPDVVDQSNTPAIVASDKVVHDIPPAPEAIEVPSEVVASDEDTTAKKPRHRGSKEATGVSDGKAIRPGTKKAALIDAAMRPEGATAYEMMVLTGWKQPSATAAMYRAVNSLGYGYHTTTRESGETAWHVTAK